MDIKIKGNFIQAVEIRLEKGEEFITEAGALVAKTKEIEIDNIGRKGIKGLIRRIITGETLLLTRYIAKEKGTIWISSHLIGTIKRTELKENQAVICERKSYLGGTKGIEIGIEVTKKLLAGIFGGEGIILQKIQGPGTLLTFHAGEIIEQTLTEDQEIHIDTGCISMMEPSIEYTVKIIKGIKNWIFGKEGIFLAKLKGPGKIWIQTSKKYNAGILDLAEIKKPA